MGRVGRWIRGEQPLEKRLRRERPEPPDSLVRSVESSIEPSRRPRLRLGSHLAPTALTAIVLIALALVGGVGYAGSRVAHIATSLAKQTFVQHQVRVQHSSAAAAQYSTTAAATTTETLAPTTTTTAAAPPPPPPTTTVTTAASTTTTPTGGVVAPVAPEESGTIDLASSTSTKPTVSVQWSAGAFGKAPVTVTADPTPALTNTTLLGGKGNQLVSISVTTTGGEKVKKLAAPLDIVFHNPGKDFVPVISEDGINFRTLHKVSGPDADLGETNDGYYIDDAGDYHILTLHLTIFAVLYKANVTTSESGRPLAAPGSVKWGDPTLIHTGKPVVRIVQAARAHGTKVRFRFFLDEQAAAYLHVRYHGKSLLILTGKSTFRGHRIGGKARRTVHIPIIRLGTMGAVLDAKTLPVGATVRLTLIDYDGHRVVKTLRIRR